MNPTAHYEKCTTQYEIGSPTAKQRHNESPLNKFVNFSLEF